MKNLSTGARVFWAKKILLIAALLFSVPAVAQITTRPPNWFNGDRRKVHVLYVSPEWAKERAASFDAEAYADNLQRAVVHHRGDDVSFGTLYNTKELALCNRFFRGCRLHHHVGVGVLFQTVRIQPHGCTDFGAH